MNMGKSNLENKMDLNEIYSHGITGKGIAVAVLDTGIYLHRDFLIPENKIRYFYDFVNRRRYPYDDNGHGTHVSGIIASGGILSDGTRIGVAPNASLCVLKVLDARGSGKVTTMVQAIEWILLHHKEYGIRIVNISVGMPVKYPENPEKDILVQKVEQLWNQGLVVVVAAGNEGPEEYSVTSPGISKKVITVGALDEKILQKENFQNAYYYSGRGPVAGSCVCKPDVVAPASRMLSCDNRAGSYRRRSGTSMATPVVSGAIALLLSAQPWLTNLEVKIRLMESSIDCGVSRNLQGWGRLNPVGLFKVLSDTY